MAAEVSKGFPSADVELIPGARGIFDVKHGDELVFSKHDVGRFPHDGEIPTILGG